MSGGGAALVWPAHRLPVRRRRVSPLGHGAPGAPARLRGSTASLRSAAVCVSSPHLGSCVASLVMSASRTPSSPPPVGGTDPVWPFAPSPTPSTGQAPRPTTGPGQPCPQNPLRRVGTWDRERRCSLPSRPETDSGGETLGSRTWPHSTGIGLTVWSTAARAHGRGPGSLS